MLPISDFAIKNNHFNNLDTRHGGMHVVSFGTWSSFGKIKIKVLVAFGILLAALFTTQLVFAANLSTDGQKLATVEDAIFQQQSENADLKTEIARQSSLVTLSQKAKDLGFIQDPKIITP